METAAANFQAEADAPRPSFHSRRAHPRVVPANGFFVVRVSPLSPSLSLLCILSLSRVPLDFLTLTSPNFQITLPSARLRLREKERERKGGFKLSVYLPHRAGKFLLPRTHTRVAARGFAIFTSARVGAHPLVERGVYTGCPGLDCKSSRV